MAPGRKTRRRLLFGMTLITILITLLGSVYWGNSLESNPLLFVIFWAVCFICAMLVIGLAFFDMRMVRKEFSQRQLELDDELAKIVAEAEEMADLTKETEKE